MKTERNIKRGDIFFYDFGMNRGSILTEHSGGFSQRDQFKICELFTIFECLKDKNLVGWTWTFTRPHF